MAKDIPIKYTQLFINNEFVNSKSGKTFPTYNPSTEEIITQVQEGDKEDIDAAVAAARKAFDLESEWRQMDASARGQLIHKFAQLMRRDIDYLAKLESLNNGKPLAESTGDIDFCIKNFEYYAGWTDKIFGKTIPVDGPFFTYTRHEPIGVCGQIIPWSYPILMLGWKLGPALACGNTVVLKPADETPLTALYIASLFKEAGFPPGVVNVVPGMGPTAGHALSMHLDVNKIAFTGSTEVGKKIQEASAKSNLKRVGLELGGKSPFIICECDDDILQKAADDTAFSMFTNQGQSCCASSRIFVHESVYDKFIEKFKTIAESKVVGDAFDEKTTNGSLISARIFNRVMEYIKIGKEEGARLVTGGQRIGTKGYFVQPTIFADCQDDMRIAKEEILGPVATVFKFKHLDEAIKRSNATIYGLAAGIYTSNINQALKAAHSLDSGSVWINCFEIVTNQAPFGGFKQSGHGRDSGDYALQDYTEVKNVTIRLN